MAKRIEYIHSQMLTIDKGYLILPNTAIAEIVNFSEPTLITDGPAWALGTIKWRGINIPLLSIEHAMGNDMPTLSSKTHIAILNCLTKGKKLKFYGILTVGLPRLVNINEDKLLPSSYTDENPLVLSNVVLNKSETIIPNLDALESLVKKAGLENSNIN